MADRRRIVTMSSGGRPVLELDLEVAASYQAIMDTFAYQPGQANQQASREPGRYGGQQVVGEQNDNGTVSWQALVQGATPAVCAQNIEALLTACNRTARDRLLEWRPEGAAYSSYFRIAGPASWKPTISWKVWQGTGAMVVEVSFPVRPLVLWDPMTIVDDFSVDSTADYTFDGATVADVAVSGGALTPVVGATLATERRARHTVRGYPLLEGQATVKATPGSTLSGFKAGVVLRGSAPTTYVEVYVDDNGTNSRLRVDVVIAGTRTNRATVNLASRVSNGTALWVRGRIAGGVVFAEHFTSTPTPTGGPTTQSPTGGAGYTLVAGDAPLNTTAGSMGWSWVPQQSAAILDDFEVRPFYRRNMTAPALVSYADAIPGTAPALADVTVTKQGFNAIPFGLIGWSPPQASGSNKVMAILDNPTSSTGGLSAGAQAGAYGGNDTRITAAGAVNGSVVWPLTGKYVPDDFADSTVDVEVWARVVLSSGLVNARASAWLQVGGGPSQYTEFGSTGRTMVIPSSGTVYRFTRLGVITVPTQTDSVMTVNVGVACDAGSAGPIGVDMAVIVPARRRAASITGVSSSGYPVFLQQFADVRKRINSDLTGELFPVSGLGFGPDSGLGGALIQPLAGALDTLIDVHEMIPDDPTASASGDPLGQAITTALDVVPRSYLLRGA